MPVDVVEHDSECSGDADRRAIHLVLQQLGHGFAERLADDRLCASTWPWEPGSPSVRVGARCLLCLGLQDPVLVPTPSQEMGEQHQRLVLDGERGEHALEMVGGLSLKPAW